MSPCNYLIALLSLYIITNLYGLVDCDVKDLIATGKPVLVDEEFLIEKHQKFKLAHTSKPDTMNEPYSIVVADEKRSKKPIIVAEQFTPKNVTKVVTVPLRKQTLYKPSMKPIVLDPVRPYLKVGQSDRGSHNSVKVGQMELADKANDKEVVLASYRVVIPIFIPKVLVPVHQSNNKPRREERIKFVETKSTKLVPVERNVTYIEEIYKPEIIPQKIVTDYVIKDPNNKNLERIVKTVVRDITEPPIKLH